MTEHNSNPGPDLGLSGPFCSIVHLKIHFKAPAFLYHAQTSSRHPPGPLSWSTPLASILQTLGFSAPWGEQVSNPLVLWGHAITPLQRKVQVLETKWDPLI